MRSFRKIQKRIETEQLMSQNKNNVIHSITRIFILFFLILTAVITVFCAKERKISRQTAETGRQDKILALNEIRKLTETDGISPAEEKIQVLMKDISGKDTAAEALLLQYAITLYLCCVSLLLITYLYLSNAILRPFQKLQGYAADIAAGNFDIRLNYERKNVFGAFTWAFDHMRREIEKARSCEQEAIENNKTVIATLSHDIKTPIASIRAYTEALEANMDSSAERRQRYLSVILRKCDEVTNLTDDLFLHSLSDMDKLKVVVQPEEISTIITETIVEFSGGETEINIEEPLPHAILPVDKKRLKQALSNVIANAKKYAPGRGVFIWAKMTAQYYEIYIRDGGKGVYPEDVPFLFEKFYRGKNKGEAEGAGLGLYIVRYIMNQMDGEVELYNYRVGNGLTFVLRLPLKTI